MKDRKRGAARSRFLASRSEGMMVAVGFQPTVQSVPSAPVA